MECAHRREKFKGSTKVLPGKVSPKLDFGAYSTKTDLVVYLRNGKSKMGSRSISIACENSPASIQVQRVYVSKPLSIINKKEDGKHLFETFSNSGKAYDIYYHIKGGKLDRKITVSTKSWFMYYGAAPLSLRYLLCEHRTNEAAGTDLG